MGGSPSPWVGRAGQLQLAVMRAATNSAATSSDCLDHETRRSSRHVCSESEGASEAGVRRGAARTRERFGRLRGSSLTNPHASLSSAVARIELAFWTTPVVGGGATAGSGGAAETTAGTVMSTGGRRCGVTGAISSPRMASSNASRFVASESTSERCIRRLTWRIAMLSGQGTILPLIEPTLSGCPAVVMWDQ